MLHCLSPGKGNLQQFLSIVLEEWLSMDQWMDVPIDRDWWKHLKIQYSKFCLCSFVCHCIIVTKGWMLRPVYPQALFGRESRKESNLQPPPPHSNTLPLHHQASISCIFAKTNRILSVAALFGGKAAEVRLQLLKLHLSLKRDM